MAPKVLAACFDRGEIRQRNVVYRVDSEIGRFTFATHEVCLEDWVGYRTTELLPRSVSKFDREISIKNSSS